MEFRISELKQKLHLTSKQIADDLKVSPNTVSSWLSGKRTPRPSQITSIEHIYNLNPGWITGKIDNMYPCTMTDCRRKQVKDIMTCQSDFAIDTVIRLTEASDSEWEVIEKLLK